MHRMRRKGVEGAPGLVVEREGGIGNGCGVFGLWRVCFPPCLVRPGRRLPVQRTKRRVFGLWRVRFPPCLVRPGRRLPVQGRQSE